MEKILSSDFDQVFCAGKEFCQNCTKCAKKYLNYNKNLSITNKNLHNETKCDNDNKCKTLQLFCEVAAVNNQTYRTQLERVRYYRAVGQFLGENCGGSLSKKYARRYGREWAQVALYTYEALPNICRMIETVVDERAGARSQNYGLNIYNENTLAQANTIISLLDRKTRMINMHIRVKRALADLPEKLLETAKIRYFERKNVPEMAKELNLSNRTCQRRTEQLLDEFVPLLDKYGLNATSILEDVAQFEPWMMEWFRLPLRMDQF